MIENDQNFEIYADAISYDQESGAYDPGDSILLDLAAGADGPVLELGCGTGRVTIPLAERGFRVTGLDVLPHLIEHARSRARELPIRWVCQDARTFQLNTQFPLIYSKGALFNHLLTRPDQEAMLSRVRQHLAPEGKFILDVTFKRPDKMVSVTEERAWYTFTDGKGREVQVSGTDRYDHVQQIWYQTISKSWKENGRTKRTKPIELALRYFMPQEMDTLLNYNSFQVLSRYGDWQGNRLSEDSAMQVYVCTHL